MSDEQKYSMVPKLFVAFGGCAGLLSSLAVLCFCCGTPVPEPPTIDAPDLGDIELIPIVPDAGVVRDAGVFADAGGVPDAGTGADAFVVDAHGPLDAAPVRDGPPPDAVPDAAQVDGASADSRPADAGADASPPGVQLRVSGQGPAQTGTRLWVVNLDRRDPAVETALDAAGRFTLTIAASAGDELRLQFVLGQRRGAPVDGIVSTDGRRLLPAQRIACLGLQPETQLDFGRTRNDAPAVRQFAVVNACARPIELSAASLRFSGRGFALPELLPLTVPAGARVTLDLRRSPGNAGLQLEVLLLRFEVGAQTARYPLTVFAHVQ